MSVDMVERWVENRATGGARALRLGELYAYRELVYFLALRDVKARYKQAVFGFGWAIVQPVAGVAIFALVFRRLAGVPSDGIPYPVFALLGFLLWSYFSASVGAASASLVSNASLVTKVYFPRLAAPAAALLPGLVNLAVGLGLLAGLMAVYDVGLPVWAFVFPLSVIAAVCVSLGVGVLLAALNVKYRDVGNVIGLLMQLWLLASPVAYPSSLVPSEWEWVYALNPMVGVIDSARWSLLGGPAPGADIALSAAAAAVVIGLALHYFQRTERQFADVI